MRRKYNIDSHHGFASHSLCGREDFFHNGVDVLLRLVDVDIYINYHRRATIPHHTEDIFKQASILFFIHPDAGY